MYSQNHKSPFLTMMSRANQIQESENRDHLETFQNLIKYIVRLRRAGMLDDNAFSELISQATGVFVENEISERIENVIENKIPYNILPSLFL